MLKKSVFMTKRVPRGKTCFLLGKTTHYQLCVILVLVNEGDVLLFFAIPTIFIAFPSNFAFCVAISHKMLWHMFVLVVCSYKKLFTFLLRTLFFLWHPVLSQFEEILFWRLNFVWILSDMNKQKRTEHISQSAVKTVKVSALILKHSFCVGFRSLSAILC